MEIFLPEEITEIILRHENLSISDAVHFSLTNKYYYDAIRNNNTLWRKKYFQRWPQFSKLFKTHDPDFCWFEEIQYIHVLKQKARELLYAMHLRLHEHYQLLGSDFSEWMDICEETPRTYHYLIDDIRKIVNTRDDINTEEIVPMSTPGHKTLIYYASKVLLFLLTFRMIGEWNIYESLPERQRTMEKMVVMLIQCCRQNYDMFWKDIIPNVFDKLAEKVKEHLKVIHPNHPLFAVPEEDLKTWKNEDLDGNKYDVENCKEVVQALGFVLGRQPNFNIYNAENPEIYDSLKEILGTDLVKVCGEYKAFYFMYQCVARRLGLKYDDISSEEYGNYTALRLSRNFCVVKDGCQLPLQRTEDFVDRLGFNLVRIIDQYRVLNFMRAIYKDFRPSVPLLKLFYYIKPSSIKKFMHECYVDHTIHSTHFINSIIRQKIDSDVVKSWMRILAERKNCRMPPHRVKNSPKLRPPNLKYAVGMVMRHTEMDYICVIYGWDPVCLATPAEQRKMDIDTKLLRHQPFYYVLCEDGLHQYIPQDFLRISDDIDVVDSLDDLGRHFSHGFEMQFVPNAEKERQYPEDSAVRKKFHQKLKSAIENYIWTVM